MEEKELKQECLKLMETVDTAYLSAIDDNGFPQRRAMLNLRNKKQFPALVAMFQRHDQSLLVYLTTNTPSAKMRQIEEEIRNKWEIEQISIHHRVGRLGISEASVVIAISAAHRQPALEACTYAIERLKQIVPIWKKEVSPDGSYWVGMGS